MIRLDSARAKIRGSKAGPFHAQANLLLAAILSRVAAFNQSLKYLHDRSGQA